LFSAAGELPPSPAQTFNVTDGLEARAPEARLYLTIQGGRGMVKAERYL
jgi:hypothetical protein